MILIKDSVVFDGTGRPGQRGDILIKDDKIVAVGNFPNKDAELVINGLGMSTTPGFIDVDTDSDHYLSLFSDPAQQDFLLQGVTTIMGGTCGSSLAPLLYGTLESIRKWADPNQINVDWNTVKEFLQALDKKKLGVNFGTLIGHSTIRRALLGEDMRDLTASELDVFVGVVKQSMEEGAFGLSTGLSFNHAKNTPYIEIKMLTDVVAKYGGVYTTHLRSEKEGIVEAVTETLEIAKESKVKTIISHLRPILGYEKQYEQARALLEADKAGSSIHFDAYPFDYSLMPVYFLLPDWARRGGTEKMLEEINEPHHEKELLKELPTFKGDEVRIARAPGFDYLVGKTLGEYAKNNELPPKQALLKLMKETKLKAVVFRRDVNGKLVEESLFSPRALVASNSPSLIEEKNILENERATRTFTKFLTLASARGETEFARAVNKLTGVPATLLGLANRGVIREGAVADLTMLKNNKAVNVLLGGKLAVIDGAMQEGLNGAILRRT